MNTLNYKGKATKNVQHTDGGVIYLHHFGTGWQELVFPTHDHARRFAEENGAEFCAPQHCCDCPHVDYMTVSISLHLHECSSCGERFKDAAREKRYFGKGPR